MSRKNTTSNIKAGIRLLTIGLLASGIGPAYAATRTAPPRLAAPPPEPGITLPGITLSNQQTVNYSCEDGAQLPVTYINTQDGQGFAVLPVDGKNRLFVTLLSGSGARYCSGPYVWWSKGAEATLWNEQDARHPLHGTCSSSK